MIFLAAMWVLVYTPTYHMAITVPGIVSKEECESLGNRMTRDIAPGYVKPAFKCYQYEGVK